VSLVFDAGVYSNLPGPELARQRFDCLSHAGPKVLFLSRLNPIKAPELAIAATAKLMRTHDLHLVLAGPGDANYIAQLRQLASEQGCANRLTFVGEVSGAEKLSLYQACDLFMLPTRQENFGMVYPEAIACGLPVVTSDTIDLANELAALGVRVVPRTVSAFAEAADELLGDLAASHLQADETRRQMFEWLDTDRVVAEYVAMYERATANPPHSDATANKL
jgi:glycosyltransferase involved in cell wall biosynthesis